MSKRQRRTTSKARDALEAQEEPSPSEIELLLPAQAAATVAQQLPVQPPQGKKGSSKKAKTSSAQQQQQHQFQQHQAPSDATLEEKIRQNQEHLHAVEKQIYTLETLYFENANPCGNAIKGYENLFATNAKKAQLKHEDRIFSGSSVTGQLP